jgi:ferredoxin--NADP+ reductase
MKNENQKYVRVEITDNLMISQTSGLIRFKRNFTFKAGQVIGITTSEKDIPRLYSIASAEKDENIEILYKIIPAGELTPKFMKLKRGNYIYVSPPFGNFISPMLEAWFIATGTGIAPFISMLKSGNAKNNKLIHGSRHPYDFYFSDYLETTLKDNYIKCFTGHEDVPSYKGRVTQYLYSLDNLNTGLKYYLCGSAEMVVDTREILIRRGVPFRNILSEIYF